MFIAKSASRWERLGNRLSICRPKKQQDDQNKLARVLLAAQDIPGTCGKRLLGGMPVDVLVHIFLYLDVADVLSLAQVSHLFNNVSQYLVVWQNLAFKLMLRGRRVAIHDFVSSPLLSAAQLRQSVLVTEAAEASWRKHKSKHLSDVRIVRLANVDLDHASYVMKFTSRRHLVLPTKAGELVGWDTHSSARSGDYSMGPHAVLINVQGDYTTRSLYWITGKMSSDLENENNLLLKILRIQFPHPASAGPIEFEELGSLQVPWSLAAELHFLDASQQMICAVFEYGDQQTTGINVIFDWKAGSVFMCDTGVPYEYGRAVIGLHLSEDKKFLILHSEHCGTETRRAYSISYMRARASVWNASRTTTKQLPQLDPIAISSTTWQHDLTAFTDRTLTPHTVWVLPQWWPIYPGVPRRASNIILYSALVGSEISPTKIWRAAQHYSDAVERVCTDENSDNLTIVGGAPCSSVRSVVDITNPVMIELGTGLPILAQSFNHLGWIEECEVDFYEDSEADGAKSKGLRPALQRLRRSSSRLILRRQRTRKRRTLKLVTFPDPGVSPRCAECNLQESSLCYCPCTTLKPVSLDVPESVLNITYHMFLDPASGTITLATEDNELHVYQYGRIPLLDRRDEEQEQLSVL